MRISIQNGNTNALRRMLEDDCIDVNADISQVSAWKSKQ